MMVSQKRISIAFVRIVVIGSLFTVGVQSVHASTADDLYQQAVMAETGERDLKKAMVLYEDIVKDPNAPKIIKAKAQLHIGMCYERLGQTNDARVSYQEILTDASEETSDIIQLARANLNRLENSNRPTPTIAAGSQSPADPHQWELSLEGGGAFPMGHIRGFWEEKANPLVWGSLGYRPNSYSSVGLQAGYVLPMNTNPDTKSDFYAGPSLTLRTNDHRRFSVYLQAGLGALIEQHQIDQTKDGYVITSTDQGLVYSLQRQVLKDNRTHVDFASPVALGVDIRLSDRWSLGVGIRDLLVVSPERIETLDRSAYTDGTDSVTQGLRQVIAPFGRLVLRL